jgi:hypothetical protein
MKRIVSLSVLCLVAVAFAANPAQAQKQAISGQVVLGFPMGDMADGYGVGFGLEGTYLHLLSPQVHLTGSLGYKSFGADEIDGNFHTIPLMVGIRYGFEGSGVKPYIAGALGLHFWTVSVDLGPFGDYSTSGTDLGVTPMFGVLIPAGNMMVDLTARYDLIFDDDSMGWLGINAGLLFSLD